MKFKAIIVSFLIVSCVTQTLLAAGTPKVQADWSAVQNIAAGADVRVETKSGAKFIGRFDRADDSSINITPENGQALAVSRPDVKKVYRIDKRGGSRGKSIGIWSGIGAAVGLGVGGILLAATGGSDETAKVWVPFIAAGAAVGAAVGAGIGKGGKKTLIYEAR